MTKEEIVSNQEKEANYKLRDMEIYKIKVLYPAMELYAQHYHKQEIEKVREKVEALRKINYRESNDWKDGFAEALMELEGILELLNTKE